MVRMIQASFELLFFLTKTDDGCKLNVSDDICHRKGGPMEKDLMSKAEWQVMRVLWANPGTTSSVVIGHLSQALDWQPVTVKTLLSRLKGKALVATEKVGGKYQYWPLVSEEDQLRQGLKVLQSSICSTKQIDLLLLLLEMGDFTRADLKKLGQQVDKKFEEAPESLTCLCLAGQCTCGQKGGSCHG